MGSFSAEVGYFHGGKYSNTDYEGLMPVEIDQVQDAKGKVKKGKNDHQMGKGKDAKGKGKKGKEIRKEQKVITRAKIKEKTKKEKRCGNVLRLWKARISCLRLLEKQVSTGCK